jgi:hypothetical protein
MLVYFHIWKTSSVTSLYVLFLFHHILSFSFCITLFILPWEVHLCGFWPGRLWKGKTWKTTEVAWIDIDLDRFWSILRIARAPFGNKNPQSKRQYLWTDLLTFLCSFFGIKLCHPGQLRTGIDAMHHLVRPGLSLTPVIKRWNGQPLAFWKLLGHLPTHCLDSQFVEVHDVQLQSLHCWLCLSVAFLFNCMQHLEYAWITS